MPRNPISYVALLIVIAAQCLWIYLSYRRSKKREGLFRIITENAADMIAVVDTKGRRLYNSPSYYRILGYTPRELAQTSGFEQIHPDDRFRVLEASREARTSGVGQSLQYRLRHKNGSWRMLESTASTIKNDSGEVEKLVIINRDVTERVEAEEKLAHNVLHDSLTDLPNRRFFLDRLQRSCAQSMRDPEFHYSVLLIDLDGFKALNHSLGSAVGDQLLVETGLRLRTCLTNTGLLCDPQHAAPTDVVLARLGDDEFAILLEGCANPSTILRFAEHIQSALSAPLVLGKQPVRCTISVGSAVCMTQQAAAEDVLRDAESALRRARALGTGRSELFDAAMHNRAVHRLKLEADLRTALNRNQFRVLYQPMLRIAPRQLMGFEALLRWQHPQHGLIAPDEFLAAAEDTGLMAMIDQWVIREAYRQVLDWRSEIGDPLRIAVNLSARHFASPALIDGIRDCLRHNSVSPGALQLEADAQVAMRNPEHTVEMFAQLKHMGVVTALDDFGNSALSLSSLRRCGCDLIKIDRALITSMQADRTSHDVVDLILSMARKLSCEVIAEGVEKAAQLEALRGMGCNFAQGYFFSSPLDAQAAQQYLQKTRAASKSHS